MTNSSVLVEPPQVLPIYLSSVYSFPVDLSFKFMEFIKMGPIGRRDYIRIIEWDEVGHNIISHIIVSYDISGVRSIQFGYVENGALVMSKTYGGSPLGLSSRIVRLKHESEFITGISMEIYSNSITSLTFHTNQRKHEAVHLTFDTKFSKPQKMELHSGILERSEFGGFFGTRGDFDLFSIGICVRLNLPGAEKIKNEKV